jgi:hypothetical protein
MICPRCVAVILFVPSIATAQAGRDALIPRELAEALISRAGYGMSRPEIVVGTLPQTIATKIKLPMGARILGGMTTQEGATAIVVIDGALNTAAEQFHRDVIAQGWEVPVDDPMDFMRSEFVDAVSTSRRMARNGMPEMYCGRAGTLMVSYQPEGIQHTQVSIGTSGVNRCAENRDMMMRSRMGMGGDPKRPKLVNHPAARNSPGVCPQYNMGMGDRKTDLGSQLPPSDILAHYAKQLADSGWAQIGTTVAAIFQKRDTTGAMQEYQLLVHAPTESPGCRSVRSDLNSSNR